MFTLPVETGLGRIILALVALVLGVLDVVGLRGASLLLGGLSVYVALAVTAAAFRRARAVVPFWPVGPVRGVLWSLAPFTNLLFLAWWPARLTRELRRGGSPPPVLWSLLLLGASVAGLFRLGVLTPLAWLAFAWFLASRLGELEEVTLRPGEEARVVPWFDTLWLSGAAVVLLSPPDLLSTLLLLLLALPPAAMATWIALGWLRRGALLRRVAAGATALVIPVLFHAVMGVLAAW